jgi:predicted Zn-dependent protease DUF2268
MNQTRQGRSQAPFIDLIPNFLDFWEAARDRPLVEQQRLWYERYEAPHHELFALADGRHGNPEHLPSVLAQFPVIAPALPGVAAQVEGIIAELTPALCALFGLPHLDLRWVLLVGMFWSDGWVVELDGIPTCFIAVEHLAHATPARARLLLGHEAAHVAHAASLGQGWHELTTIGHHLFLEGVATVASARVVPGRDPAAYAWLGLTHTMRGLGLDAWTVQCEAAWPHERVRLQQQLLTDDRETFARYFLQAPPHLPERMGYWIGWHLVTDLLRQYPFTELVRWSPQLIQSRIRTTSILA